MQPTMFTPMQAHKYTSSFQMNIQVDMWGGIESDIIGTGRKFMASLEDLNIQHKVWKCPLGKVPIPTTNASIFSYEVEKRNHNKLSQVLCHV